MQYLALIGDIIDSKKIEQRHFVQEQLNRCLKDINHAYSSALASNFSVTLGDEFQGLLYPHAPVFRIIDEINLALHPYHIRFGLGLGEIVTAINPKQSIGADGPAYWHARTAIQYVHQKNDYGYTQVAAHLTNAEKTNQINALLASTEFIKANWRDSQRTVFKVLLASGIYEEQFEQTLTAEKLGLTVSAFSKRLKSSGIKVYFRGRQAALSLLREAVNDQIEEEN